MVNRRELRPDSSPRAAFGAHLRRQRELRNWSQEELAALMEYSSQHISAVETGRKPPTLPFSRKADLVFGTVEAGDSFERKWHEMRRGSLLEGFPEYVEYERRAVELRIFEIGIIPGLLQTPEYAQVVNMADVRRGLITQQQAEERISFVAERQASLLRRLPLMLVVLDESCIRRPIGGTTVMDAQLQQLVDFAERPHTMLQVAPFSIGERRPFNLPASLSTLADRSVVAYGESHLRGFVERESSAVRPPLMRFLQLQAECLSQAESVAMIQEARKGTS
ncbi:helix-turn-helix domain-containing protein [Streptomyces sp. NPDC093795]|uniref:helix-turn-helix domain-containing protein n=1 Tax=Streptomyces sp. NPDC093795 TaxID=3366051 RepID=UPI0037F4BF3D